MGYSKIVHNLKDNITSLTEALNSVKGVSFDGIWSGDAYNNLTSSLKDVVSSGTNQKNLLIDFVSALEKLQSYKNNCKKIESLESSISSTMLESDRADVYSAISGLKKDNNNLKSSINKLLASGVIIETLNEDERVPSYQPAFDISELSVGMLFNKVDLEGAGEKSFRVNRNDKYKLQWDTVIAAQEGVYNATNNILIKDLEIEQPIK